PVNSWFPSRKWSWPCLSAFYGGFPLPLGSSARFFYLLLPTRAAREHALLMFKLNTLEHQLPDEPSLEERVAAAGARFSYIAENVAIGADAQSIHTGWMNSPGHRKNILNPRVTAVGIAAAGGNGGFFAVQDFSQSSSGLTLEQQEKQVVSLL